VKQRTSMPDAAFVALTVGSFVLFGLLAEFLRRV
jgi:hypothetical protein